MEHEVRDTTQHKPNVVDDVPPVVSTKTHSKTKRRLLIAVTSILVVFWWAMSRTPASRAPAWVNSFNISTTFSVYEGLPHPTWETELLEQEKQRSDLANIDGFDFYTPSVAVNEKQILQFKEVLGDNDLYYTPLGLKDCGFHPDFAVEWTDSETHYQLLICFTCNEVQILSEDRRRNYDLTHTSGIESLLSKYSIKRPRGPHHYLGEAP